MDQDDNVEGNGEYSEAVFLLYILSRKPNIPFQPTKKKKKN